MVLSRPYNQEDQFTTSILRHWAAKHDDLLGEHIKALLIKNNNMPRKRQRLLQNYSSIINPLYSVSSNLKEWFTFKSKILS